MKAAALHVRPDVTHKRATRCGSRASVLTVVTLAALLLAPTVPPAAAVTPQREVIALVIEGVGFGHGRGMSQWGAYGRAVNGRQSWQQILDAYFGGTTSARWHRPGSAST